MRLLSILALASCWLLSPESLIMVGNGAGTNGLFQLLLLPLAVLPVLLLFHALSGPHLPGDEGRAIDILGQGLFPAAGLAFPLAARLPITVMAGTALLVTAGYTFNEVFLSWFPNFGFAFLLLALILALNLAGRQTALYGQIFFMSCAGCGLLILIAAALLQSGPQQAQPSSFTMSAVPASLLIFSGLETVQTGKQPSRHQSALLSGFLFFLFILMLWALVSLQFVNPSRLANSTIPYAVTARKILGNPGRLIMGMVIIAGACGAVNGLFLLSRSTVVFLCKRRLLPAVSAGALLPLLLAVAVGIAMMTGLAGHESLEVFLRGSLLLWLLHNGLLGLAAGVLQMKTAPARAFSGFLSASFLCAATVYLLINSGEPILLNLFFIPSLAAALAAGLLGQLRAHHVNGPISDNRP